MLYAMFNQDSSIMLYAMFKMVSNTSILIELKIYNDVFNNLVINELSRFWSNYQILINDQNRLVNQINYNS